ncbi:Nif3-like dinuclear metal center hexameric protein [Corynebacterium aquatimens]|uniref:Nif3-like dinuclear metal center hexameric protein n=1 Tax=Corynebacterium aquatimens TaxID=1190508 RepID=UPI0025424EEC|nr:Nif3-like dinuclear metal center hexameric protein [Corynebacterium aquatimens]QYH19441.1 Nif3-like dinuclear metal center hexameric protein [Corynebacterium aquatimens]
MTGAKTAQGPTTVGDVVAALEAAYPPQLAESWDHVGLICGDPDTEVTKVAFALDCTQGVAEAAVDSGAQLLVVHHPLLLRGVHSVAANTPKGKVIHTLLTGGCALFAAHTNADLARPGVSDRLAELVGITPGRPIKPVFLGGMDAWGVHIPPADVERVMRALFDAGAGEIGDYRDCAFTWEGEGSFTPVEGADPTEGTVGEHHSGAEVRAEFVAPTRLRRTLIDVLRHTHPYEEPAFDVVQMEETRDLEIATGLGRIGELPEAMTLREFTQQVANALPETAWGVRAAGDPEQMVKKVAVSSGSGDSFLEDVARLGVDVYVTSDLRHHPVDEHLRAGGPAVIDTAHWASEFPWTEQAAGIVARLDVDTEILHIRTDPWTVSAHPESADPGPGDPVSADPEPGNPKP